MSLFTHKKSRVIVIFGGLLLCVGLVYSLKKNDPGDEVVNGEPSEVLIPRPRFLESSLPQEERLSLLKKEWKNFPLNEVKQWISQIHPNTIPSAPQSADLVIYNEILSLHRTREGIKIQDFLIESLENSKMHSVVRDYAAQHLIMCLGGNQLYDETRIIDHLFTALEDDSLKRTSVPGTIINALSGLSDKGIELTSSDQTRLTNSIVLFLSSSETSAQLKVSLVQSIDRFGPQLALTIIRDLLGTPEVHDALIMSSCSTLSRIGEQADLALLHELSQRKAFSAEAAKVAHKALTKRLNKSLTKTTLDAL